MLDQHRKTRNCGFFITQHSDSATLEQLFRKLFEHVPDWKPDIIVVDKSFEEINALKAIFPDADIYLCWVHQDRYLRRGLRPKCGPKIYDKFVTSIKRCRYAKFKPFCALTR